MNNIDSLYKNYYKHLVFYAMGFVRRRDVAEDIVTDAFIKTVHAADINLKSFVYCTTHRLCLDYLRQRKIRERIEDDIVYIEKDWEEICTGYDFMYAEYIVRLNEALTRISPRRREVIVMYLQGYSTNEIAARLSISGQTARNLKTEATNSLRDIFLPHKPPADSRK